MQIRKYWPRIRRVWITVWLAATAVFVTWSLIAYQADDEAITASISDNAVTVVYDDGIWQFLPTAKSNYTSLLFFPGALVNPKAYAPLARAVAESGYRAFIVEFPRRCGGFCVCC